MQLILEQSDVLIEQDSIKHRILSSKQVKRNLMTGGRGKRLQSAPLIPLPHIVTNSMPSIGSRESPIMRSDRLRTHRHVRVRRFRSAISLSVGSLTSSSPTSPPWTPTRLHQPAPPIPRQSLPLPERTAYRRQSARRNHETASESCSRMSFPATVKIMPSQHCRQHTKATPQASQLTHRSPCHSK